MAVFLSRNSCALVRRPSMIVVVPKTCACAQTKPTPKMSLSFVSKSVQTSTEDGGFVEQAIEGSGNETETTGVHKPLFEQLRDNKEQEEAEREEYQKALMRGTLALDEEDAAHLESLRRRQQEQQDEVQRRTEEELAAFRAARAERSDATAGTVPPAEPADLSQVTTEPYLSSKPKVKAPLITIKRKRRRDEQEIEDDGKKSKEGTAEETKPPKAAQVVPQPAASLGSLLTGYGSSSDEED